MNMIQIGVLLGYMTWPSEQRLVANRKEKTAQHKLFVSSRFQLVKIAVNGIRTHASTLMAYHQSSAKLV